MFCRTATRHKSNRAYRISEKQRNDRAFLRFKDEVDEGLWKPQQKLAKNGKAIHKQRITR